MSGTRRRPSQRLFPLVLMIDAPVIRLVPEFRAGATQILFENFAKFHPNFAKFSLRSSLRGPGTQPENFAQKSQILAKALNISFNSLQMNQNGYRRGIQVPSSLFIYQMNLAGDALDSRHTMAASSLLRQVGGELSPRCACCSAASGSPARSPPGCGA